MLDVLERNGEIRSAVFSPDGQHIVTISRERKPMVWDTQGNKLATIRGNDGFVWSAEFSPDGQQILTASDDGSAKIWDLAGNKLASYNGHTDNVSSAIFSPDGRYILTTSDDKTVKLWPTYPSLDDKVAVAHSRMERGFTEEECYRYFRDDMDSCPRTVDEVWGMVNDAETGERDIKPFALSRCIAPGGMS